MELALETEALTRKFGDFVAVDGLDLQVPQGSFFGFLGPNGAGKSTTLKCLSGLLKPSSGHIRILGLDPTKEPVKVKKQLGVLPENLALFERLTAFETLLFTCRIHQINPSTAKIRAKELLSLMDLEGQADQLVSEFSQGMKKKLALSAALIFSPKLLFLDEPFEGIDALTSRLIKNLLADFVRAGGTVFLTSHILEIVDGLCDWIAVIHEGRLVVQAPLSEIRGKQGRSLEKILLDAIGAGDEMPNRLSWINESSLSSSPSSSETDTHGSPQYDDPDGG